MVNVRAVRLQAPATNTTQDFTAPGFGTVQAAIVLSGIAGNGLDADSCHQSIGYWDTTNSIVQSAFKEHGVDVASFVANSHQDNTNIVHLYETNVVRNATASAVNDGVRLTWAGTTSYMPWTIVIMFNGLNGAQAGAATPNAADGGTQQETTTGITPKLIFGGQNRRNMGDPHLPWKGLSFGFAYDNGVTIDQQNVAWLALTSSLNAYLVANEDRISTNLGSAQIDTEQEITAMAAGSFTQTTRNVSGSGAQDSDLYYLALDFDGDCDVFTSQVPTTPGDWSPLSGSSITPSSTILLPTFTAVIDSLRSNNDVGFFGIYVADGANEYGLYWNDERGGSTSNTSGRTDTQLLNSQHTAGAPDFTASNPTFAPGSITYTNVSEGSKASYVLGIAFQGVSAGKTATAQLADINGINHANLTGLTYAWFDAPPATGVSPTDSGVTTTDGNGNLSVSIDNSTLNTGQTGYLLVVGNNWQGIYAVVVS